MGDVSFSVHGPGESGAKRYLNVQHGPVSSAKMASVRMKGIDNPDKYTFFTKAGEASESGNYVVLNIKDESGAEKGVLVKVQGAFEDRIGKESLYDRFGLSKDMIKELADREHGGDLGAAAQSLIKEHMELALAVHEGFTPGDVEHVDLGEHFGADMRAVRSVVTKKLDELGMVAHLVKQGISRQGPSEKAFYLRRPGKNLIVTTTGDQAFVEETDKILGKGSFKIARCATEILITDA